MWAAMTMLELNREQRRLIAEKLLDVANIAAGAMIFGQFLSGQSFSSGVAIGGMALWGILLAAAIGLTHAA